MKLSVKLFLCIQLLLMLMAFKALNAQLTPADSVFFNTHFGEPVYVDDLAYPGDWYVDQPISSMNELEMKINSIFKFESSDFPDAYNNIHLISPLYYDTLINATNNFYYSTFGNAFKQFDPLIKIDFNLKGINSTTFSTLTKSLVATDDEVGFLIIPGSNSNQTSEIALGYGYHNQNCYASQTLLNYGDVFVYCKPLEDYRALTWNGFKFNSSDYNTPGIRYIYDYLDSIHHSYGINYLIECMALIKYMNTRYKKVVVLGCSLGGYSALLTTLNGPIDGAIISSGYTMNIENDPDFVFELQQNFDSLVYQYPNANVKSEIEKSTTHYLFSWPNYDTYWYQLEHDSAFTETFFQGLTNCSYYYDYDYHTFPQCYPIDTFVNTVLQKPKLFFTTNESTHSDSVRTTIEYAGRGPFSFELHLNGKLHKSYSAVSSTMHDTLTIPGMYTIKNITNIYGIKGTCRDSFFLSRQYPEFVTDSYLSENIKISPNPFSNFLDIHISALQNNSKNDCFIQVNNITGKVMYSSNVNKGSEKIDTALWPSGFYLISIKTGKEHFIFKYCKS